MKFGLAGTNARWAKVLKPDKGYVLVNMVLTSQDVGAFPLLMQQEDNLLIVAQLKI